MARIDVEIDVDDMYWDMSRSEKQEMIDKLYEDGFSPKDLPESINREPQTYLEHDLCDLLDKVWDNRKFINNTDLETLKYLSNKGV
jgi:hypothetical protein